MIAIQQVDGRSNPIIVCDICNQRIRTANEGASVFSNTEGVKDGQIVPLLHAHKGPCLDQAEARLGGRVDTDWHELLWDLVWLPMNCGFEKWEDFLEAAKTPHFF